MHSQFPLRLGLLSTARVSARIIEGAAGSDAVAVVAVASRSKARALEYGRRHHIPRAHGSYEALLDDPGVDAVHISLPNSLHVKWTLAALRAGKHVLVEKPFTRSPDEAARCFDAAEQAGLVLTEGLMWRHMPQTLRFRDRALSGEIGEVRLVRASYCSRLNRLDDPRWDPHLHGGALMDLGCYCLSGIRLIAGDPLSVSAQAVRASTGVDARLTAILRLPDDVLGVLECAFDLPPRHSLQVVGSLGILSAPNAWRPTTARLELTRTDGYQEVEEPGGASPYRLELEDFAEAVVTGRPPLLGRADAVAQAGALRAVLATVDG